MCITTLYKNFNVGFTFVNRALPLKYRVELLNSFLPFYEISEGFTLFLCLH